MKKLILFLLLIYQTFGDNKPSEENDDFDPRARYATSIQDLINFGINVSAYDNGTLEDSFLLAPKLISKYGYPSEIHTVITDDQYILEMHRIPGSPRANNNKGHRKQPILLMHGLLDSSSTWIIMTPKNGLAYLLADLGYDVWLGNSRGNRYSRKHVTLNSDGTNDERSKYWNFSWHEIGIFDLPAMIDYVLDKTNFNKLHYIGHSQGGSAGLVLTSELPKYNDKLISMQLLASAGFMSRVKGPILKLVAFSRGPLKHIIRNLLGMYEFLPQRGVLNAMDQLLCTESLRLLPLACTNIAFLMAGYNPDQINIKMLPIIAGHSPAGAALNNVFHFLQLINSGRFCQYDYGIQKNFDKYRQSTPLDYNLNNIRTPVAMYYSDSDMLISSEDTKEMASKLPNLIENYKVLNGKFNHIDFVWGIDVVDLVYKRVFTNLKVAEQMQ